MFRSQHIRRLMGSGTFFMRRAPIAGLALAAAGLCIFAIDPANAQNVTAANVNAFNLLAPFLALNSTTIGQQTLTTDLSQSVAINQNQNTPFTQLLNGYPTSTNALAALSISDENLLGSLTNTVYGLSSSVNYGVAANLAGGLPTQNTTSYGTLVNGAQAVGGFGAVLGAAYVTDVSNGGAVITSANQTLLPNTVTLLTTALNFIGNTNATLGDASLAKDYFANGTTNGTTPAVAPAGYTLPTFNGLPNTTTSVYDTAYGVSNTQSGQNSVGDSHPYQVAGINGYPFTLYDPTVKTTEPTNTLGLAQDKPSTNPAFPSSHMAYAMTDSVLLGMLVPQFYQSMIVRASAMGESRIVVGVHYPTDIIGSRAMAQYDLANYLSNPAYINNAGTTGTAVDLQTLFTAAQSEITPVLTTAAAGCGGTITACTTNSANTANDPYVPSATNEQIYEARLTYGLPTLTFALAPREQAPSGAPDASILLATVYGGNSAAAQTLAPSGGMYGNLSTNTINQIIVNTETNAIAAFYGTSLSYWSRINLYDAIGYFSAVTGTVTFAAGDQLNENVNIAGATTNVNGDIVPAGVLAGAGGITGNVMAQAGGTFAPGTLGVAGSSMTVTGNLALQSGAFYMVTVNSTTSTFANVSGTAALGGNVLAAFAPGTSPLHQYTILQTGGLNATTFAGVGLINQPNYGASLSYTANNVLLNITATLGTGTGSGLSGNQGNAANSVSNYANDPPLPANYLALFNLTGANLTTALSQLDGEAATGAERGAFQMTTDFLGLMLDPFAFGRGGVGGGGQATGFAPDEQASFPPDIALAYNAVLKAAPPAAAFYQRWTAWGSAFGSSSSANGNAAAGSNNVTARNYGFAAGMDYHFTPDTLAGFALAGGGTNWGLAQGLGGGRSDAFQVGVYGKSYSGPAYVAAALSFTNNWMTTNRIAPLGDQLTAKFDAQNYGGRIETGYRYAVMPMIGVTPYAALQAQDFRTPSYGETDLTGGGFGLSYNAMSATDTRSELGARFDDLTMLGSMPLILRSRVAWAHDWVSTPALTAQFAALPGTNFVVNGAPLPKDSALTTVGAELKLNAQWTMLAKFDGGFGSGAQTYTGSGTLRYTW